MEVDNEDIIVLTDEESFISEKAQILKDNENLASASITSDDQTSSKCSRLNAKVSVSVHQIYWHDKGPVFSVDFVPIPPTKSLEKCDSMIYRFATCGSDCNIRLWDLVYGHRDSIQGQQVGSSEPSKILSSSIKFVSTLRKHLKSVNVVRFRNDGKVLASAGDDGYVCLWKQHHEDDSAGEKLETFEFPSNKSVLSEEEGEVALERWIVIGQYRCSNSLSDPEINDIAWSPCGNYLYTVGSDHSVTMFDVTSRETKVVFNVKEHVHFVQGIAVDPRNELIATQSSDASVRFYRIGEKKRKRTEDVLDDDDNQTNINKLEGNSASGIHDENQVSGGGITVEEKSVLKKKTTLKIGAKCVKTLSRIEIAELEEVKNVQQNDDNVTSIRKPKFSKLFQDETLISFYRRLSFSPDGSLCLMPAGKVVKSILGETSRKTQYCFYGLKRSSLVTWMPVPLTPCASAVATVEAESGPSSETTAIIGSAKKIVALEPDFIFPGFNKSTVCIRFQKCLYERTSLTRESWLSDVGHKMIFAVISQDAVHVYDTESFSPLLQVSNIHLSHLIDASWSSDGNVLLVTSNDGYVSSILFPEGYFGIRIPSESIIQDISWRPLSVSNNKGKTPRSSAKKLNTTITPGKAPEVRNLKQMFEKLSSSNDHQDPTDDATVVVKKRITPTFVSSL